MLVSAVGEGALAYDLATETAHVLNAAAGVVLQTSDGVTRVDDLASQWSEASGTDADVIRGDIESIIESFTDLGLVGRIEDFVPSDPLDVSTNVVDLPLDPPLFTTTPFQVIDTHIVIHGSDEKVIAAIEEFLGGPGYGSVSAEEIDVVGDGGGHIVEFTVSEHPDGGYVLSGPIERGGSARPRRMAQRRGPTIAEMCHQVTMVMNRYAAASDSCVVLHSGGVRGPNGEIIVLPAESESGKSTLTAAFVAQGWDYLSDEAIGIREQTCVAVGYPKPFSLSSASRSVLGLTEPAFDHDELPVAEVRGATACLFGDVDAITRVVLPTYKTGVELELVDLNSQDAVLALLANTLNLAHVGQSGLDALCDLAERVPVQQLTHSSAFDAMKAIVGND